MKNTFTTAYNTLLKRLNKSPEKSPRGQKVRFLRNYKFSVALPGDVPNYINSRPYRWDYLNQELSLYFSGDCSVDEFTKASKFWGKLVNPDGKTINSNYGYLVFNKKIENEFGTIKNQWEWAKTQLLNDRDTRQAVMFISSPHVQFEGNKDFICTLNYTFDITDNKLNLTVNRRSQDVILGIVYDYAWEYLLMVKMLCELKPAYPDLNIGNYTLFINNVHLYERNFELAQAMLSEVPEAVPIMPNVNKDILNNYVFNSKFIK